jgi:hypothetical protein
VVIVSGQIAKLIRDDDGGLKGIVLNNGLEIRLHTDLRPLVSPIVSARCSVRVEGLAFSTNFPEGYLDANRVTNLDSHQSAALPALKHKGKPGMQLNNTPVEPASLAHSSVQSESDEGQDLDCAWTECDNPTAPALHPSSFFRKLLEQQDDNGTNAYRNDAARSIGLGYDSLHRIQAILAYLHIMKHRVPGISQFLDEAKHTYVQAMTRFTAGDFISSKEFAEASASLSRVVEIVIARTLRSDTTLPSLVPPPPKHSGAPPEPEDVEENLAHAESVLSRIYWVLEHGTLPSEDRAQVRRIASWGDAFYRQAQRTYKEAVLEDASEFAQAALAGAYSAEHVCRKWYVNHPGNSPGTTPMPDSTQMD